MNSCCFDKTYSFRDVRNQYIFRIMSSVSSIRDFKPEIRGIRLNPIKTKDCDDLSRMHRQVFLVGHKMNTVLILYLSKKVNIRSITIVFRQYADIFGTPEECVPISGPFEIDNSDINSIKVVAIDHGKWISVNNLVISDSLISKPEFNESTLDDFNTIINIAAASVALAYNIVEEP